MNERERWLDAEATAHEKLGLRPGHSLEERRKQVRAAITRWHPDKGGDAAIFPMVIEARNTISDDHKRWMDDTLTRERVAKRSRAPQVHDLPDQGGSRPAHNAASEERAGARTQQPAEPPAQPPARPRAQPAATRSAAASAARSHIDEALDARAQAYAEKIFQGDHRRSVIGLFLGAFTIGGLWLGSQGGQRRDAAATAAESRTSQEAAAPTKRVCDAQEQASLSRMLREQEQNNWASLDNQDRARSALATLQSTEDGAGDPLDITPLELERMRSARSELEKRIRQQEALDHQHDKLRAWIETSGC